MIFHGLILGKGILLESILGDIIRLLSTSQAAVMSIHDSNLFYAYVLLIIRNLKYR